MTHHPTTDGTTTSGPPDGTAAAHDGAGAQEPGPVGLWGLARQSGPAFLASGLNIGSATVTNAVLLAAATGFLFGWVFFAATLAIYVATLACVKLSMITGTDPIELMRVKVHPGVAWANAVAILLVNLVFHATNALLAGLALNALVPGVSIRIWTAVALGVAALVALLPSRAQVAERILKYFLVGLGITYLLALFVVPVDWGGFFSQVFAFNLPSEQSQVLLFTAVMGSALAINVPVIQAYGSRSRGYGSGQLPLFRFETAMTNLLLLFVQFAVLIVVASTLFPAGIEVTSAVQAGAALEPVAGRFATVVFALGLLGACVSTLAVQTQVSGYVISDVLKWKQDVGSRRFKTVQAGMLLVALTIPLFNIDPFQWTTWGAAFNSTFMPIGIATWWWLINRRSVMGRHRAGWLMNGGLAVTFLIATAAAARFWYVTLM